MILDDLKEYYVGDGSNFERVYTKEQVIKLAFDFYFDMSIKMNVPTNLISENRDNAKYYFDEIL